MEACTTNRLVQGPSRADVRGIYPEAVRRNRGLISASEQEALSNVRVGLPGLGGVGGIYAQTLVRLGIRRFHLADFDRFEVVNFHRQFCATLDTLGLLKTEGVARAVRSVDPEAEIAIFERGIAPESVDSFLDGLDIVLDGLDFFQLPARRLLFNRAQERGIPVVTVAPLGFSAALLVFTPGGMTFDEYFDITDTTPYLKAQASFAVGLAPRPTHMKYLDLGEVDLASKRGPAVAPGVVLCSAVAATEAVRILLGRGRLRPVPHYSQLDLLRGKWRRGKLRWGVRGPLVRILRSIVMRRLKALGKEDDG